MHLHVRYVFQIKVKLFAIIQVDLQILVLWNCSVKPWLLGVLQCVEDILSGIGLFQLLRSMVRRGNSKLSTMQF